MQAALGEMRNAKSNRQAVSIETNNEMFHFSQLSTIMKCAGRDP